MLRLGIRAWQTSALISLTSIITTSWTNSWSSSSTAPVASRSGLVFSHGPPTIRKNRSSSQLITGPLLASFSNILIMDTNKAFVLSISAIIVGFISFCYFWRDVEISKSVSECTKLKPVWECYKN